MENSEKRNSSHNNPAFSNDMEQKEKMTDIEMKKVGPEVYPETPTRPKSENEEMEDRHSSNPIMAFVALVQTNVKDFKSAHSQEIKYGIILFVVLCWCAYLLAALIMNFEAAWPLALVTVILACFICYYQVLKPLLQSHFDKLWEQIVDNFERVWRLKVVKWITYIAILAALVIFLIIDTSDNRWRLMSGVGLLVFILLTFLFSHNPAHVNWRPVFWGIGLQFILGLLILRFKPGQEFFKFLSDQVTVFLGYTDAGSSFVYGFLVIPPSICGIRINAVFAFAVLSTVIFFSSVISVLYFYGVLQFIIVRVAGLMQLTMGTTAAESLSAAGNIFVGQTESPLLIKPYLAKMTRSELHAIMTGGFATIAGTVFKVYVEFGACGNHILTASVMSAPAALAISKLFYPETKKSRTKTMKDLELGKGDEKNALEAAANGACNGIFLVSNIVANLIAFLAFLAFFNAVIGWLGSLIDSPDLSFEKICGWLFYPFAYIMGASRDHDELMRVAELMGIKTFVNEFVAYAKMGEYDRAGLLSSRAKLISTYALCGFSNIAAVGIQLGGIGAMCPEKRQDLAKVAVRALIAGSVACFMTACVAGLLSNEVLECTKIETVQRNCTQL